MQWPGSITPGQTNTLLISSVITPDSSTVSSYAADSGFTVRSHVNPVAATSQGGALADLWMGAAVAKNPTWNGWTGSVETGAVMIQFAMSAGPSAGGGGVSLLGLRK